ncbi:MFS transporter [Paenibacillus thiaminolyticus]|uniref:MFS transporter n=1 Tax=Paenibacillus thiaminolyticus TaxID=49283 RepID=A0AAP9DT84_PANTH|nr:MFS transporter [Paenibacillus thiaminolyticus]MCY9538155.1 MFS transporter [Paenibacillus thiaminolyticus]MCY9602133.1 MFS transporter [Paenibacillus thiaminolyticus]MCY9606007.1 MFS transporter [Paenibacillus thiaminolyticus]MCY9612414.1 MFS transporter [Paenibacillus thiaminolyticus]MCY9621203.1 MFS transporter [Paenibacillus thiaminolyticus]
MNLALRRTVSFIAIILGFFIALLDTTIVNVALPEMTRYFGGSVGQISWVVNGYNLAFAVFIMTAARLADQFGRKKVFLAGVLLFTLASLFAGLAPNAGMLIAMRVVQGLAGAIIVPVTVPMAMNLFPKEMHGMIIGIWGAISGLAAASGPALGGILTEKLNWQWIFYVNVPLGIVCMLLTLVFIKESYDPTSGRRIDYAGTLAITAAMFCLTYGLIQVNEYGWDSLQIVLLLGGGGLLLALFFVAEWKGKEPMLPLSMLRIRAFNGAAITMLIVGAGLMMIFFLTSFFLTRMMEMSELRAGLLLSVVALGSMLSSSVVGPLSNRFGSRLFAVAGLTMMGAAAYWLGSLEPQSTEMDVVARLALAGFGMGMTIVPVMASSVRHVPEEKVGISSGVVNMTKALGSALGVALIVTMLQSNMTEELEGARMLAADTLRADTVLDDALKEQLSEKLAAPAPAANMASPKLSAETALAGIEEQAARAAAELPPEQRKVFAEHLDGQMQEVKRLLGQVEDDYRGAATRAFSRTFVISCWLLLLGIPFAWISDKRRARSR